MYIAYHTNTYNYKNEINTIFYVEREKTKTTFTMSLWGEGEFFITHTQTQKVIL